MASTVIAERKVIIELTELLKKNSDKVLSGNTKLCLTTSSLSILAANFRRYSERGTEEDDAASARDKRAKKKKGKPEEDERVWKDSIRTLIDFVMKVKAVKIIMGSNTLKSPIQINRFRSLQVLEVKKVPIHMLEGLSKLRMQLKEITVSKSLLTLKDLLEVCGGDRTPGLVWSNLKIVYLGFNLLQKLDQSLCFIPFAEIIDLSHNSITSTDNYLMNLTDIVRINFAYNLLKAVPQFSTGNIAKLKTLIMRNNNLENIEGVEVLTGLEELDLAENFLIDHKVLQPLSRLKKLQILCLTGNPMSFKDDHRLCTLRNIPSQAGSNDFILDGKKLTATENLVVSQNHFQYERPFVQEDSSIVSHLSPHGKKKKKGHVRTRSKERIPKITDIQDNTEDIQQPSGSNTPSTSQTDQTDGPIGAQDDEEYFKTIREHYKEDWLKALTVSQNQGKDNTNQSGPLRDSGNNNDVSGNRDDRKSKQENGLPPPVSDKAHKENSSKDKDVKLIDNRWPAVSVKPDTVTVTTPAPTPATPTSPEGLTITENTDIYALASHRLPDVAAPQLYSQYSIESLPSPQEQESEQYGPESDPFIVMLPDKDMTQLFVTVNTRFINEKNINGTKLANLDLKYLQKCERSEETCYSKDIIDGCVFPVLTMNFDYTRKDLRQRRYAMESKEEAEHFESLVNHHVMSQSGSPEEMECLKCQHEFIGHQITESEGFNRCPKCDSKLVIKRSKSPVKAAAATETVTLEIEKPEPAKRKLARTRFAHSPSRNWVPDKEDNSGSGGENQGTGSVTSREINIQKRPSLNDKYSSGNSLKDYVDQLIPDDDKPDTVPEDTVPEDTVPEDTIPEDTIPEDTGLRPNLSSSEIKTPHEGRDSLTSVESDIAVLARNPSREGFSTISEKTHNAWLDDSTEVEDESKASSSDIGPPTITQIQITPVGSPLNNLVCSSMVSSVYKNAIPDNNKNQDVTNFKTEEEKSSYEDDIIATPVKRRSKNTSRKSKHREITMYKSVIDTDEPNLNSAKESKSDISKEVETVSQERNGSEDNISVSIYDTAIADPDHTDSKFETLNSTNQSSAERPCDTLSANQVSNSHSSPLRRRGGTRSRSRSRSRSRNRSAIYVDSSVQNVNLEDHVPTDTSDIPEFPSELSPIKRTGSRRSRQNNRSAIFVDKSSEISDSVSTAMSSTTNDERELNSTNETGGTADTSSASSQLPWELTNSQSGDGSNRHKHESLIHDEFINIDHSIKLYLELQVFKADETAQCAIECNIVQYMNVEKIKSLLVISTHRIMIFRYQGNSTDSDWLKCYEDQPISELQYIDIGLGYQTLRLEFCTVCSSFTLLIADQGRCKQFFTLISDIVQREANSGHSQLQRITKSNPVTLDNLTQDVLTTADDEDPQIMVQYLMVHYQDNDTDDSKLMSLVITESDMVLLDENHQWPLPRLQASLSEDIKGRQFTVVQREKINNIESLMFNEYNPAELRLTFFETSSNNTNSEWIISFETVKGVKLFVDAIRQPWEDQFGFSLDIKSTSFSDANNSNVSQHE